MWSIKGVEVEDNNEGLSATEKMFGGDPRGFWWGLNKAAIRSTGSDADEIRVRTDLPSKAPNLSVPSCAQVYHQDDERAHLTRH